MSQSRSTGIKAAKSSKISSSLRVALIAFALSSWFEGYAQLRHSVTAAALVDSRFLSLTVSLDEAEGDFGRPSDDDDSESARMSPFWRWVTRRGRRMDDAERGIMGTLDVIVRLIQDPSLTYGSQSSPYATRLH
jgi:hypothetical protein